MSPSLSGLLLSRFGDAPLTFYAVLAQISLCYSPLKGRLLMCYSPVRHYTRFSVTIKTRTVRLECVMHAASVHPEPGSNSLNVCIYTPLGINTLDRFLALCLFLFFFKGINEFFMTCILLHVRTFILCTLYFVVVQFSMSAPTAFLASLSLRFRYVFTRFKLCSLAVSLSIITHRFIIVKCFFYSFSFFLRP